MNKFFSICCIALSLLFLTKNSAVAQTPDALDICHDSVERITTLLSRFPKLAEPGSVSYPLLEILNCANYDKIDSERRYQIIELLLRYGANPNSRNEHSENDDHTPLSFCGDSVLAELLIKYGANVDIEQGRYSFGFDFKKKVYKFLNGTGVTPLFTITNHIDVLHNDSFYINQKSAGLFRALLNHGADPNAQYEKEGASILLNLINNIGDYERGLFETIPNCALDLIKILVDAGANVNFVKKINANRDIRLKPKYIDGDETPLSAAVRISWPLAVEYLISKGANVNFRDHNKDPILYHAIKNLQDDKEQNEKRNWDDEDHLRLREKCDSEIIGILSSKGAIKK